MLKSGLYCTFHVSKDVDAAGVVTFGAESGETPETHPIKQDLQINVIFGLNGQKRLFSSGFVQCCDFDVSVVLLS